MAQIGRTVAGSTEPMIFVLKIEGVPVNLDGYTVDPTTPLILTLSDGTAVTVAGTVAKVADQTTNTGHVKYTPHANDLTVTAGTLPRESEKHWARFKMRDGSNVPLHFPIAEPTDWIDVYRP